jgi:hypothetical protein
LNFLLIHTKSYYYYNKMTDLIFEKVDVAETSLLGYLYLSKTYADRKYIGFMDMISKTKYDKKMIPKDWTFEMLVAKLLSLSNQDIFKQGDQDKQSFCVLGKYKDQVFTLSDYKADQCIRIEGKADLDVTGLREELKKQLKKAEAKSFEATIHYNKKKYKYKHKVI